MKSARTRTVTAISTENPIRSFIVAEEIDLINR